MNNKELLKQANDLLNQAVEVISFLEEVGGINNCGYNTEEDEKYVKNFFDKLKKYGDKNEINKALSITEDDVCPKCNQYPYSDTDKHCPVCFDEIRDYIDDDICNAMNRYIKKGFISKNGNLFFDDDEIVADFNYHIEGLKNLIKMTYKEKK